MFSMALQVHHGHRALIVSKNGVIEESDPFTVT